MKKLSGFFRKFSSARRPLRAFTVLFAAFLMAVAFSPVGVRAEYGYDLPWLWPVPGSFKINCLDYYYNGGIHNSGQCMDIGANGHTAADDRLDVVSATSGRVLYIQKSYNESSNRGAGWGNYVIVQSGGINIVYAHLKEILCDYGNVNAGDVLGKMGNTGNSTGVHLHLQAYPADEGQNSTKIPVFEQYRQNPLYMERFSFLKGLEKTSERYAEWISTYYTALSGSYYTFTGGETLPQEYPLTPVSAIVTAVNAAGAPVRNAPAADVGEVTATVPVDEQVAVTGYYTDAYGERWLFLEEERNGGRWVSAKDVGFYSYRFGITLEEGIYPQGSYGTFGELRFGGTLRSANRIVSYTAKILSGDRTVASYTRPTDGKEVSLSSIAGGLGISSLSDGSYRFVLTAAEEASYPEADTAVQSGTLVESEFTISASLADTVPPSVGAIRLTSLTPEKISLSVTVADNRGVDRVVVTVSGEENGEAEEYLCALAEGGEYVLTVPASDLPGAGAYTLKAEAFDLNGNSAFSERKVSLPTPAAGEVWYVIETVKIRNGPGLKEQYLGTVTKGNSITVTEIVEADGHLWGKHSKGYSALREVNGDEFTSYVSGYLYSVSFDLNGGTDAIPAPVNKRYGEEITLPADRPEKEGEAFLGWATDSGADAAEYTPGGPYAANASATLFAVYGTAGSPDAPTEIQPKSDSGLFVGDGYLFVPQDKRKAADLLAELEKSDGVSVYSPAGEKLNDSDATVGTGAKIVSEAEGQVHQTLTVVILGDVDGDGVVTATDAESILKFSNGMAVATDPTVRAAADVNRDGKLTSADAYLALVKS